MTIPIKDLKLDNEQTLNLKNLHDRLLPFILRRVKSQVEGQLPDKVYNDIVLEMSPNQKILYKQYKDVNVEKAYRDKVA